MTGDDPGTVVENDDSGEGKEQYPADIGETTTGIPEENDVARKPLGVETTDPEAWKEPYPEDT